MRNPSQSQLVQLYRQYRAKGFEVFSVSVDSKRADWTRAIEQDGLTWTQVLDESRKPFFRWFVGGRTNIAYNCLDAQVAKGLGDKVAIVYEGEPTAEGRATEVRRITYREAVREGVRDALRRDARVFLMGEDVGRYGGAYAVSKGLLAEFGPEEKDYCGRKVEVWHDPTVELGGNMVGGLKLRLPRGEVR